MRGAVVVVLVLLTHASSGKVLSPLELEAKAMDDGVFAAPSLHSMLQHAAENGVDMGNDVPSVRSTHHPQGSRPGGGWGDMAMSARYKSVVMSLKDSPFFNERYRQEFEAWRDSILYTQMKLRMDFETQPAFVPGVGYLRPFVRYPNFIPPAPELPKPPSPTTLDPAAVGALAAKAVQMAQDTHAQAKNAKEKFDQLDPETQALIKTQTKALGESALVMGGHDANLLSSPFPTSTLSDQLMQSLEPSKYPATALPQAKRDELDKWAEQPIQVSHSFIDQFKDKDQ